jgi:hypothetical protein
VIRAQRDIATSIKPVSGDPSDFVSRVCIVLHVAILTVARGASEYSVHVLTEGSGLR